MHGKERAIAPPFRRVLGAEIVVAPDLDTDKLGTFSGEVPRPDALVETALLKAEMVFRGARCRLRAGERRQLRTDRPRAAQSRRRRDPGLRRPQARRPPDRDPATHRTNWRLQRFEAGDPDRLLALKGMGFPEFGVFVGCNSDMSHPVKGLNTVDEVIAAMDREARRSDDGLAVLYSDMRAHRNPMRMKVLRALSGNSPGALLRFARPATPQASAISIPGAGCPARAAVSPPTGSISRSTAAWPAAMPRAARARTAGARRPDSPARLAVSPSYPLPDGTGSRRARSARAHACRGRGRRA